MVHREQEIKQLQGWAQTVLNLINKFEDGLKELGPLAALEDGDLMSPCQLMRKCPQLWPPLGPLQIVPGT